MTGHRLTDEQAQRVGALLSTSLTASGFLTLAQVEAQNRRAYGRFTPGSPARQNRAEAWARGERTCERCGAVLPRTHKRFCSKACQFPKRTPPSPEEIAAEGRAALVRLRAYLERGTE